jgi:hypothetical protein
MFRNARSCCYAIVFESTTMWKLKKNKVRIGRCHGVASNFFSTFFSFFVRLYHRYSVTQRMTHYWSWIEVIITRYNPHELCAHCHDSQGPKTSFHMTHPTFDSTMTCENFRKNTKPGWWAPGFWIFFENFLQVKVESCFSQTTVMTVRDRKQVSIWPTQLSILPWLVKNSKKHKTGLVSARFLNFFENFHKSR